MAGYSSIRRVLLTAVLCVSWNVTTAHCAFAAAIATLPHAVQNEPDECPMHATQKQQPEPAKKNGCDDLLCCKNLPAAKPGAPTFASKAQPAMEAVARLGGNVRQLPASFEPQQFPALDTGPARPNILIDLKRSIPANAPPLSLV
jgi:hypothetical protein